MPATSINKHIQRKHLKQYRRRWAKSAPLLVHPYKPPREVLSQDFAIGNTVTCQICGQNMLKGFLKDHLKRHRQEKKKPAAAETDPGSSPAIHRSADSNFNGNTSGTKEDWYRDADGYLWLGPPSERDKHIVDAPLSKSSQPSKTVPFPTPYREKIHPPPPVEKQYSCPICHKKLPRNQIRQHILGHPGITVCPVCNKLLRESSYSSHMIENHLNWCPVCHETYKDLVNHLRQCHKIRPAVKMKQMYTPMWEFERKFTCSQCNKPISLFEYPDHQQPHRPEPKPADSLGTANRKAPGATELIRFVRCQVCGAKVQEPFLEDHIQYNHPVCPYCQTQLVNRNLQVHIERKHPGKPVPYH
jgi:DNA-directed RNA polymerase subunit RPC12/RpoP